jgi:hypothetical protein
LRRRPGGAEEGGDRHGSERQRGGKLTRYCHLLPEKEVSKLYATLDFAKGHAWAPFIKKYTNGLSNKTVRR